jgi:hypothetical protein
LSLIIEKITIKLAINTIFLPKLRLYMVTQLSREFV